MNSSKKQLSSLLFVCASFLVLSFTSCSKKDSSPGTEKGESAKFTFTVTVPANSHDDITIVIGGMDPSNYKNSNLWKINGVAQGSQSDIALDGSYFPAGKTTTVVIESQVPLTSIVTDFTFGIFNPPYVVTYTPVINGGIISGDALNNFSVITTLDKNYTYN